MIRYTSEHQWVRLAGETGTVGVTAHAGAQLGDVVHVALPKVGQRLYKDESVAVVESVKAASEVFAPVAGTVTAVNEALVAGPGAVNADPEGAGWFFRLAVADPGELDGLMDADAYRAFTAA